MDTKPMTTKIFKGGFREIGRQQGAAYRRNGVTFGSEDERIDRVLYRNQRRAYEKHYPQFLEECRGIAEGGGYDEERVTYQFITSELAFYRRRFGLDIGKGCTIFGVQSGKKLYVGRNYDWIPAAENVFGMYKVVNPARNTFVSVSDMDIYSARRVSPKHFLYEGEDALNNKGLYIGITFAYADHWTYGISWSHMVRLIAETCATVDEALRVFKKVPVCCPKNFFLADARGDMAAVEHAAKEYRVVRPRDGVLIQTNHFTHPDLLALDAVLKHRPAHNTFLRYYEALREINLRREGFERRDVPAILRKPGSYVCQNSSDDATIWTLALDMTARKYELYWGLGGVKRRAAIAFK